jgi:hypothetical protein
MDYPYNGYGVTRASNNIIARQIQNEERLRRWREEQLTYDAMRRHREERRRIQERNQAIARGLEAARDWMERLIRLEISEIDLIRYLGEYYDSHGIYGIILEWNEARTKDILKWKAFKRRRHLLMAHNSARHPVTAASAPATAAASAPTTAAASAPPVVANDPQPKCSLSGCTLMGGKRRHKKLTKRRRHRRATHRR